MIETASAKERKPRKPKAPKPPPAPPICPYCQAEAVHHENSARFYQGRDFGPLWACEPCQAWVGCHPGGKPLGRLANAALRKAKMAAHDQFDVLWKAKAARNPEMNPYRARGHAYRWLAAQLGIEEKACHIALFDEAMCRRVVEICSPYARKLR